jgi:anthranilate synthase component 2
VYKTPLCTKKNMSKLLFIDNYDSFTYNLVDYLAQGGAQCEVCYNNIPPHQLPWQGKQGLVLSPGPETPAKAGFLLPILKEGIRRGLPILGICLGHQAIGQHFGWTLTHASKPMHGKRSSISCIADPIFEGLPRHFSVVRYHSLLLLPNSGTPLQCIAQTEAGEVMALKHQQLPIYGVQFHPEAALTEHGLDLMHNWLRLYRL